MIPEKLREWPRHKRIQWLEANADRQAEDEMYHKPLSPEEVQDLQHKITEQSVDLNVKQRKYDELKAEWRAVIKGIKSSIAANADLYTQGRQEVVGTVFFIADYDNSIMRGYDTDGQEVLTRPLTQKERQRTLQSVGRIETINQ